MKKLFIVAVLCFFGLTQSNAQVTFKPGLRGGLNFSHFTQGENYLDSYGNSTTSILSYNTKTDYYIGFYGALHLTRYYTLQPEIDYSKQGTIQNSTGFEDKKLDISYLSFAIVNKFTFNNKFNVHVGPTIDLVVDHNKNINSTSNNLSNNFDLAFLLGAGYKLTNNIELESRVKKGIVPVLENSSSHTNVVFSLGATYTFDLK
jgi:hypothetical protein